MSSSPDVLPDDSAVRTPGSSRSTGSTGRLFYVDDEELDLDAILRPPAVLQDWPTPAAPAAPVAPAAPAAPPRRPEPAPEPEPEPEPEPVPEPQPPAQPAPPPPAEPEPQAGPVPDAPVDIAALLAAATAAMADVDAQLAEAGVPTESLAQPDLTPPDLPQPDVAQPDPASSAPAAQPPRVDAAGAAVVEAFRQDRTAETQAAVAPAPPLAPLAPQPAPPAPPATRPEASPPARRRRQWPLRALGAAVALALMAGTGWFLARGPLTGTTATPSPTAAPSTASVPMAPMQGEYAAVLAAVTSARTLTDLGEAAGQATTLAHTFTTLRGATDAGEALVRAQTTALQTFGTLDGVTAENASRQFPAVMPTLTSAGRAVTAARSALPGDDPGTDTTPAVRHVLALLAKPAVTGLTDRVTALLDRLGKATRTADLRSIGADGYAVQIASQDTAAILGTSSHLGTRANNLREIADALVALKTIDGEHLDQWSPLSTRLTSRLRALALPTAAVTHTDQMIDAANLVLQTWEELHAGPTTAELAAYRRQISSAMKTWTTAWAALPEVSADERSSTSLTKLFTWVANDLSRAVTSLRRVDVPDGAPESLTRAHRTLVEVAEQGRDVALAGRSLARAGGSCLQACTLGETAKWKPYAAAVTRMGNPTAAKTAWQAAYDDAAAEAAAVPPETAKPTV